MRPAYLVRGLKEARSAESVVGQDIELAKVVRKDRMEGRCRCVEADCCAIPYHGWHHRALWLTFSLPLAVLILEFCFANYQAEPEILCKRQAQPASKVLLQLEFS